MILPVIVFFPLAASLLIFLNPYKKSSKHMALGLSLLNTGLAFFAWYAFEARKSITVIKSTFVMNETLGIKFIFELDGVSLMLLILTQLIGLFAIKAVWGKNFGKGFWSLYIAMQGLSAGALLSMDLISFYLFIETLTVALFLLKFLENQNQHFKVKEIPEAFWVNFFGSLLFLASIICLMILNNAAHGFVSSDFNSIKNIDIAFIKGRFFSTQTIISLGFLIYLFTKLSVFPFHHLWQEKKEITLSNLWVRTVFSNIVILSSLKFFIPLFEDVSFLYNHHFIFFLSICASYMLLMAVKKDNFLNTLDCISMAFLSLVLIGLFSMTQIGTVGAIYLLFYHSIFYFMSYFIINSIHKKFGGFSFSVFSMGFNRLNPVAIIFTFLIISLAFIPFTGGFTALYMILLGLVETNFYYVFLLILPIMLYFFLSLSIFNDIWFKSKGNSHMDTKLSGYEKLLILPWAVLLVFMTLSPSHSLNKIKINVEKNYDVLEIPLSVLKASDKKNIRGKK